MCVAIPIAMESVACMCRDGASALHACTDCDARTDRDARTVAKLCTIVLTIMIMPVLSSGTENTTEHMPMPGAQD